MTSKIIPALGLDVLTPFFDRIVNLVGLGDRLNRLVIDLLPMEGGERVLDIGCGTGSLLLGARQRHPSARLVGLDADWIALDLASEKARSRGQLVALIQASADALPLASGSVDLAVSKLVFHHLPREVKERAFREIIRVLKPGGKFLLADLGPQRGMLAFAALVLTALPLAESRTSRDNLRGDVPQLFRESGFTYAISVHGIEVFNS